MKFLVLAVVSLSLSGGAFGQRRPGQFWSLGGYGNVLFPGTGHAPATPPGGVTGPHFSFWPAHPVPRAVDPQSSPVVVVPSPVYDPSYTDDHSGIYAEGDPSQPPPASMNPAPPVTINQNFVSPQGNPTRDTHDTKIDARPCGIAQGDASRSQAAYEDQPTIYLIAFQDHRIVEALGYWMEAGTLHYITAEYSLNQASMVLIDRDLSQRLNYERGIAFKLPASK